MSYKLYGQKDFSIDEEIMNDNVTFEVTFNAVKII